MARSTGRKKASKSPATQTSTPTSGRIAATDTPNSALAPTTSLPAMATAHDNAALLARLAEQEGEYSRFR